MTPSDTKAIVTSPFLQNIITYVYNLTKTSKKVDENLDKLFFQFIWNGKTDRICRCQVVESPSDDELVHLYSNIKSLG